MIPAVVNIPQLILTTFLLIAAGPSPVLAESGYIVTLSGNRFAINKVQAKEFRITAKDSGFTYRLTIWDELTRAGMSLYCQQALQSMPLVFKGRGFALRSKEHHRNYMGFTYSLDQKVYMEYMRNFDTRAGFRICAEGDDAESSIRIHDVLFLINNAKVIRKQSGQE